MPNGTSALQREKVKPLRSSPTLPLPVASHEWEPERLPSPVPSHLPLRTTGARIGPSDDLRSTLEGNTIRPDAVGEGDPRTAPEMIQRLNETPVGNILLSYLTGGSSGGGSGVMQAVAGVPPGQIKALREAGKARLDKIAAEGVTRVFGGQRAMTPTAMQELIPLVKRYKAGELLSSKEMSRLAGGILPSDYEPNIPLNDEQIEAFRMFQQRYPRIWGHIESITGLDRIHLGKNAITEASDLLKAPTGKANLVPLYQRHSDVNPKFSQLHVNPELMRYIAKAKKMNYGEAAASDLAHELYHVKDQIRLGQNTNDMLYKMFDELVGYWDNPLEVGARDFGDRGRKIFEATQKAGGNRNFLGKNPRVPLDVLEGYSSPAPVGMEKNPKLGLLPPTAKPVLKFPPEDPTAKSIIRDRINIRNKVVDRVPRDIMDLAHKDPLEYIRQKWAWVDQELARMGYKNPDRGWKMDWQTSAEMDLDDRLFDRPRMNDMIKKQWPEEPD